MLEVVPIALCSALCMAIGFVVQQHAAAEEPPEVRLSFRLLANLIRRPIWLAGIGAFVVGQILGAVALGLGSLALVEPIMATNLLFALPLAALWRRRRLGLREWSGALALIAGLTAFLWAGNPHGGSSTRLPWPNWAISGGTIGLLAFSLVAIARRQRPSLQASLLAAAAGALYGLQDALTQRTIAELRNGIVAMLASWPAFSLLVVAAAGLLLAQSAFEAAPLAASLPVITAAEPITGVVFGLGVYHEHLGLSSNLLGLELSGFAVMLLGVFLVAGSPVVTGQESGAGPGSSGCDKAA